MDFGITLWGSSHISYVNKIFIMQKKAIRIISGATCKYNEDTNDLFKNLKLIKLHDLYRIQVAKYMFSPQRGTRPTPLIKRITYNTEIHHHNTRNVQNPHIAQRRTNIASKNLRHKGPEIWYQLPEELRNTKILETFAYHLKKYIINSY